MTRASELPRADTDRTKYITSTDMRSIVAGGQSAIDLVKEKRGGPGPNLDHVFKVQLGKFTEPFHAAWHCKTNNVTARSVVGLRLACPARKLPPWVAASFDNELTDGQILELKHTNARAGFREKADYYMPQLQWQMLCTGDANMRFSLILGNDEPVWGIVDADPVLQEMLLEQAETFRDFVKSGAPPENIAPPAEGFGAAIAAVKVNGTRAYDWRKNNQWQALAGAFVRARAVKPIVADVESKMKALVPADASEVTGTEVSCKRTKSGSITWQINDAALEAAAVGAGIFLNVPTEEGKS